MSTHGNIDRETSDGLPEVPRQIPHADHSFVARTMDGREIGGCEMTDPEADEDKETFLFSTLSINIEDLR